MIINGTNANDQITGTGSADIINARNGNDTVGAGEAMTSFRAAMATTA